MKNYDTLIYLLYIDTPDGRLYKIGHTKKSIQNRLKQLQTGCPYEINILYSYKSEYGQKIERTFHKKYETSKTHGEWFNLDIKIELEFIKNCEFYEKINETLKNNRNEICK